ncbi:peptidoglycan recognition family protein [Ligilactobacillus salivarius]|uniref:peptidoglycan recognition protein family protein n=1 Tax=Ligilactobacillus salivarius TaxID=1624 RepID=UPI0022E372D5|nr:N-acetylmuramoyl-L-alanine amidase [Ligilactobacillus salivarius]
MQKNRLYFLLGSVALLSSLTLGVNSAQADATVQQSSASVEVQTSTGSETNTKETTSADISVNQNVSNVEDGSKHSESSVASSNSISKENEYVSSESKENTSSVSTTVQSSSEVSQHLSQKIATSLSSNTTQLKNGWYSEKDNWYYYNNNMQKGWFQGGNDWYYFNPINGQMQKSWLQGGNDWYYFNPVSGRMQKNWLQGGDDWYYFNPISGHMQKSWLQGGHDWYYFTPTSGHMQKGWLQGGNDWYYFNPVSGRMQRGYAYINGVNYNFSNSGRQILNYSIDYRYALPAGKGDDETAANNYLILHEVGTESGAATNARYFHDTVDTNEAYVTFVVGDGGKVYQVGRPGQVSWGAGRVANHNAPVQIELGRTYNSGQFWQDYVTYVRVARDMAGKYGIPLTLDAGGAGTRGIKSHYWVTKNIWGDHVDPYGYLSRFGVTQAKLAHDLLYGV